MATTTARAKRGLLATKTQKRSAHRPVMGKLGADTRGSEPPSLDPLRQQFQTRPPQEGNIHRPRSCAPHYPRVGVWLLVLVVVQGPEGEVLNKLRADLVRCYEKRDGSAAEAALSRARERYGDLAVFYRVAGVAAHQAGDDEAAIAHFRDGLAQQPDDYRAWIGLSRALHAKDPYRGGVEEARRAISLEPDRPDAYVQLSCIYVGRTRVDEGLAALDAGLARAMLAADPDLMEEKCLLLVTSGRYEDGLAVARVLVERHPRRASGHFFLGRVLSDRGEIEASLASHQHAAELAPRNSYYRLHLGLTLRRLERYREAWSTLGDAKRLDPRNATIRYNLAQVSMALGYEKQARSEMIAYYRLQALHRRD